MDSANLEFVISGDVTGESGKHTVSGRCGDKAIHLGDVFLTAFRAKPSNYPAEMGGPDVREVERPVRLRVEHIHAYGQCLELLGEGMTGSLELSGAEAASLGPGWILVTENNPPSAVPSDSPAIASHPVEDERRALRGSA